MQKNQIVLMDALKQAEAGLEVAVGRISSDEKDRGDFKPSEVLALEAVRNALTIFDAEEGASDQRQQEQTVHSEPSSAEQAAWHAGLDEGRAQKSCLVQIQEPAVNQQLTTEQEPVWGQSRFHGQPWMSCAAEHVTMVLADQRYAAEGYEARYLYAAPVLAAQPEDPMDWRLPCDVTVGGGTIGKGCRLGTLVLRMKVLYKMATGEDADEVAARTVEQRTEFLAALRQQAATEPQAAPAAVAVPDAVRDALLQSEAALEVATARILKADPDHSISVTSEAKALVAVRAALAATPAAAPVVPKWIDDPHDIEQGQMLNPEWVKAQETAAPAPVVLPEPWGYLVEGRIFIGRLLPQHVSSMVDAEGFEPTKLYTEPQMHALLATGGQAQAVQPITGPCGQCKSSIQPCDCEISTILKDRGLVAVDATHYSKVSAQAKAAAPQAQAVGRGEVLVTVSGFTGSGKSAIAGEIEILCRALGLQVEWPDGESEKNMTHADWTAALEQYKPRVRIVEQNIPFVSKKGLSK